MHVTHATAVARPDGRLDEGPLCIFQLGGPVLAVGSDLEEARHRAERALGQALEDVRRWGEAPTRAGHWYFAPCSGDLHEAVRTGARFVIPADSLPDAEKIGRPARLAPPPIDLDERFSRALDGVCHTAAGYAMTRAAIAASLARVCGDRLGALTGEAPTRAGAADLDDLVATLAGHARAARKRAVRRRDAVPGAEAGR
jgi:hypothetical protein